MNTERELHLIILQHSVPSP